MGNKAAKENTGLLDQERSRLLADSARTESYMVPERHAEKAGSDSLRDEILSGYRNFASGGAGGGGGGGGGRANIALDSIYSELEPRYRTLSTGMDDSLKGYREFSETGGINDAMRDRIRGSGVYDEMARTGGYSEGDKSNIRSRSNETTGAFYKNLKAEMDRRKAIQGGYAPGFSGSGVRMARESSIAGGRNARDTELGISDSVRQGRMEGANALSGAERAYTQALQGGRLAGLGGMQEAGRMGYGGLEGVAGARMQVAQHNAAAAASRSAASGADERYANQLRLQGLGGLESMYGSNPAELARYDENLYNNRGLTGNNVGNTLGLRTGSVPESGWDKAAKWGSLAAGIGGAAFTGGASLAIPGMVMGAKGNNKPFAGSQSYAY